MSASIAACLVESSLHPLVDEGVKRVNRILLVNILLVNQFPHRPEGGLLGSCDVLGCVASKRESTSHTPTRSAAYPFGTAGR